VNDLMTAGVAVAKKEKKKGLVNTNEAQGF